MLTGYSKAPDHNQYLLTLKSESKSYQWQKLYMQCFIPEVLILIGDCRLPSIATGKSTCQLSGPGKKKLLHKRDF